MLVPPENESWRIDGSSFYGSRASSSMSLRTASKMSTKTRGIALVEPLPNLFRATFEQAHQQSPGEQWLKHRVAAFDIGAKQKRKEVLEEFLEYMHQNSNVSSMQELFSHQAHLFFIRLTSWFAVTLPMFYELALQVKVFLAFLEFREQNFIRAFFESGAVSTLMHTLSVNFDCTDEVRCLVLVALHKLASNGRYHKELLCAEGLIRMIMECMSDGMQWETLKCAGRLLCELFCANPKYQHEVLESLQSLLVHKLPLAQRVGAQSLISLINSDRLEIPPLLRTVQRHKQLVYFTLPLLDSSDLRVNADAYCFLCRLVVTFGCDSLLFDFCSSQIVAGDDLDEWLRMEMDAKTEIGAELHETGNQETPFGGWWKLSSERLYNRISQALDRHRPADGEPVDNVKLVNQGNAEFCEALRKESKQILKWALLLFVSKRSPQLCHQLVDQGLTERLLKSLLDVDRPVQQGAALAELHRLKLMSPLAAQIVGTVLAKPDLINATSLVEFMTIAKPKELERARYRLRKIWSTLHRISHCHEARHGAHELGLRQKLLEKEMEQSIGIETAPSAAFLTSVETVEGDKASDIADAEAKPPDTNNEETVHRSGKEKFDVRRVPIMKQEGSMGDEHSRIEMGPLEDIPFVGSLSSLMFDPLDITADEESPLIQEMGSLERFGTFHVNRGFGSSLRGKSDGAGLRRLGPAHRKPRGPGGNSPRKRETTSKDDHSRKCSHRPTLAHRRAVTLGPVPRHSDKPLSRHAQLNRSLAPSESGVSLGSEMSLCCGSFHELSDWENAASALGSFHQVSSMHSCGKAHCHDMSLAETSAGPEWLYEHSAELPSCPSTDLLNAGPSFLTSSTDTFELQHSQDELCGQCSLEGISEGPSAYVTKRTPLVAIVEIPKNQGSEDAVPVIGKRMLKVAPCAPHNCLAFDPLLNEIEREYLGSQVTPLMHPKTKRLFGDIIDAGKFPKKRIARPAKIPPLNTSAEYTYPSGSKSARASKQSVNQPFTPPPDDEPVDQRAQFAPMGSADAAATAPGSMWQALEALDDSSPLLQNAGDRLKSYFPASARSAAQ